MLTSDPGAPVLELAPDAPAGEGIPYRLPSSGSIGVASGRVYVRFASADAARAAEPAIDALGFTIVKRPEWSPESRWLAPSDGDAARGLHAVADVANLEGAVHVAPEVSFERSSR